MHLTFVCFFWERSQSGFKLPSVCDYTKDHVYKLKRAIERYYPHPHRFLCITNDFIEGVDCLPLWDKCRFLGGCYNRLFVFDKSMRDFIGERFVCIDLDCVIVGDLSPLFNSDIDFKIHKYSGDKKEQLYNGSLFMMNAGARQQVWDTFHPEGSPELIAANKEIIGTDQAWVRLALGRNEETWGNDDGVYEERKIGEDLPENAKIVFFSGKRDPSQSKKQWVLENWI